MSLEISSDLMPENVLVVVGCMHSWRNCCGPANWGVIADLQGLHFRGHRLVVCAEFLKILVGEFGWRCSFGGCVVLLYERVINVRNGRRCSGVDDARERLYSGCFSERIYWPQCPN